MNEHLPAKSRRLVIPQTIPYVDDKCLPTSNRISPFSLSPFLFSKKPSNNDQVTQGTFHTYGLKN